MNTNTTKRLLGEVVELSCDCELGQEGERAVVTALVERYMTLTFVDRGPDGRDVYTGADYKNLRAYEGVVEWSVADLVSTANKAVKKTMDRGAALRELRGLVATYLESSDDAPRAAELLDVLEAPNLPSMLSDTFWKKLKESVQALPITEQQQNREREMFGCTAAAIDEALARLKEPRDIAMYAMGTLSNAQELIQRSSYEGVVEWSVPNADRANTIRQFMNIAKYAIDKAVPR